MGSAGKAGRDGVKVSSVMQERAAGEGTGVRELGLEKPRDCVAGAGGRLPFSSLIPHPSSFAPLPLPPFSASHQSPEAV